MFVSRSQKVKAKIIILKSGCEKFFSVFTTAEPIRVLWTVTVLGP